MSRCRSVALGMLLLAASVPPALANPIPIESTVTPVLSNVLVGSAPQTLDLARVFTPTGSYWSWAGVIWHLDQRERDLRPYPAEILQEVVPVPGGELGTLRATYDPAQFPYGVSDIALPFQWFRVTPSGGFNFRYTTEHARVMRLLDVSTVSVLTPIQAGAGLFGFRVPRKGAGVPTVDATIAWGDGSTLQTRLDVVDGVVRVPTGLHDYAQPGRYIATLTFGLGGETYGLTTTVAVPAPPALAAFSLALLLLTGLAARGAKAGRRASRPAASPMAT
jgi:hypothetical protein